ncbi:MAG: DMT family transporter [Gemmataceae bacterium]|nr:DMT family transporter [Gemmataceae bacterium]
MVDFPVSEWPKTLFFPCRIAVSLVENAVAPFDRLAVQEGTPVFAGFTMTLLSAAFLVPFVAFRGDRREALRAHCGGLWLRGFLEVTFMVCKLTALQYWSAPYVVGIQRFSLVLSIIGGRVFFRESDFGRRLAAGALIVGGVLLIAWLQR